MITCPVACPSGPLPLVPLQMNAPAPSKPLLDEADALFVQYGVTILVGSRDRALRAATTVACGCRVASDRRRLTVFLNADRAARTLANLTDTGAIAVNFSRPSTHRSIQFKGIDARVVPLLPDDLALISAYRDSFVADLALIHHGETYARIVIPAPNDTLTAVAFIPSQAFNQTPGHLAGRPLR